MIKHGFHIIFWILVIAVSARISFDIPLTDINITGQTLSILSMAILARPQVAIPSIIIYVVIGVLGLPVYSDGAAGWDAFSGSALGYFIGFIISVFVVGKLFWNSTEHELSHVGVKILMLQLLGSLIILFFGVLRLSLLMPFVDAILTGFTPFVLTAIAKSILGTFLILLYFRLVKSFSA